RMSEKGGQSAKLRHAAKTMLEAADALDATSPAEVALRNDSRGDLDDVVVRPVTTFRAEFMSDDYLWLACYLPDGERITFNVHGEGLEMSVGEMPEEWTDFDAAMTQPPNREERMSEKERPGAWAERGWTAHGLDCVVVALTMGYRCGYVRVPEEHPWH